MKTILPNGITVITEERNTSFLGANIVFSAGAYDDGNLPGVAHFVEHLGAGFSKVENKGLRLSLGVPNGKFNAFTSVDITSYFMAALTSHAVLSEEDIEGKKVLNRLLTALTANMTGRNITEEELERERGAILAEFGTIDENRRGGNSFYALIFPDEFSPDYSKGIGTEECVRRISLADIQKFINQFYTKANATVIVVGKNLDHQEICAIADEQLAELPDGKKRLEKQLRFSAGIARHELPPISSEGKTIDCSFAFPACPTLSPAEQIISASLLGKLLEIQLRHKMKAVYGASVSYSRELSFINIDTGGQAENARKFSQGVAETLLHYANEGIPEIEMQQATLNMQSWQTESSENANILGRLTAIFGEDKFKNSAAEFQAAFEAYTQDKFKQFVQHLLKSTPAIHVWGRGTEQFPEYNEFLELLGQEKRQLDANGRVIPTHAERIQAAQTAAKTGDNLPPH